VIGLRGLHSDVRDAAEYAHEIAEYNGISPRVSSGYRSWAEQTKLRSNHERCVRDGNFPSAPDCRFPANRPGDSAHNYGLAWDSVVAPDHQATWDAIRRYVGFDVPSNDLIHGEVPGWRQYVR